MKKEVYYFGVNEYMKSKRSEMSDTMGELIYRMENVCHSPQELAFLSGRISELADQMRLLEADLAEYEAMEEE